VDSDPSAPALPDLASDPVLGPWAREPAGGAVEQLARALTEAHALRVQLSRLSAQLPHQLAYRTRAVATQLQLSLDEHFQGVT
jgi:hypothetical protein